MSQFLICKANICISRDQHCQSAFFSEQRVSLKATYNGHCLKVYNRICLNYFYYMKIYFYAMNIIKKENIQCP